MAIDAVVSGVTIIRGDTVCTRCNGSGKDANNWDDCQRCYGATPGKPVVMLVLEPRGKQPAGQKRLQVLNPPEQCKHLRGLIGTEVWGNAAAIMVGAAKLADRVGYTSIRLVDWSD